MSEPVAGGAVDDGDHVARLLATEHEVAPLELVEHVAVADRGFDQLDVVGLERTAQTEVRHHRRHDGVAAQQPTVVQIDGSHREHLVAVDRSSPCSSTAITRSASPSNANPALAPDTRTASRSSDVSVDPQASLMLVPSGEAWSTSTSAPRARRAAGRGAEGGTVAAVDHHVHAVESTAFDRVDHVRDVVVERSAVLAGDADAHARRAGFGHLGGEGTQLVFDLQLELLGDLATAGREQLDPVVAERVVARRDHRAGRAPLRGEVRDSPGVGITPQSDTSAPSAQSPATSAASSIGPDRRVSRPIDERGVGAEHSRRGAAQGRDQLDGELGVGDTAHAVGAEPESQ